MTAKESLRELVEAMSESEAEAWLAEIRAGRDEPRMAAPKSADERPIWEKIQELAARVPPEAWDALPSSDHIDEVVYAQPKFPGP